MISVLFFGVFMVEIVVSVVLLMEEEMLGGCCLKWLFEFCLKCVKSFMIEVDGGDVGEYIYLVYFNVNVICCGG